MKSGMTQRGDTALAQAVSAARRQGVDPAALARVQAAVLVAAADAPLTSSPAGAGLWSRVRWPYLGGASILLVGALQLLRLEAAAPAPASAPPTVNPTAAPVVLTAPSAPVVPHLPVAVSARPIELPAEVPAEASPPRPRGVRLGPAVPASAPASPQAPDAPSELALLRPALAALPSQPTRALELAEQHAAEHPRGVFAQEREAIAIDAYLALQRTAAAEARVRRFLAAYPRSPHAPRMRALLGQQEQAPVPTHEQAPTPRRKETR